MTYLPHTSTALAYKANLLVALRAADSLAGVQVTYGWPGRNADREWVQLGEITWASEVWASEGARQRQEDYEIKLTVNVQVVGGTDQEASERAGIIMGAVEQYLRANALPSLGARATQVQLVPKSLHTWPAGPEAMEAQFEAAVAVSSRM